MKRLTIETRTDGEVSVLSLRGELDVATAPQFKDALLPLAEAGGLIAVSLETLEFLDSRGIGVLVAATRAAREAGGDVAIAIPSRAQRHSIEVLKLDTFLTLRDDEAQAVAALTGGTR
ncbi:MAG: STAS domain-containing protein [Armatimonadota bacterium]|jgi:anti-sigma B factor antagonist